MKLWSPLLAGLAITFLLLAPCAGAPSSDKPVDIPDSQVLKMTVDQYIGLYEKKHHRDAYEYEIRTLDDYYSYVQRNHTFRLARRLPKAKRLLVHRCQAAFIALIDSCRDYQFSVDDGTIVYDFYAPVELDSETALHAVFVDLRRSHTDRSRRLAADAAYRDARQDLRKSYPIMANESAEDTMFSKSARMANYRAVEVVLGNAKRLMDSLPDNAQYHFAKQLKDITDTLKEMD